MSVSWVTTIRRFRTMDEGMENEADGRQIWRLSVHGVWFNIMSVYLCTVIASQHERGS